jgi:hypothetical protein
MNSRVSREFWYTFKGVPACVSHHVGNPVDGRSEDLLRGVFVHAAIASHRTNTVQARVHSSTREHIEDTVCEPISNLG